MTLTPPLTVNLAAGKKSVRAANAAGENAARLRW